MDILYMNMNIKRPEFQICHRTTQNYRQPPATPHSPVDLAGRLDSKQPREHHLFFNGPMVQSTDSFSIIVYFKSQSWKEAALGWFPEMFLGANAELDTWKSINPEKGNLCGATETVKVHLTLLWTWCHLQGADAMTGRLLVGLMGLMGVQHKREMFQPVIRPQIFDLQGREFHVIGSSLLQLHAAAVLPKLTYSHSAKQNQVIDTHIHGIEFLGRRVQICCRDRMYTKHKFRIGISLERTIKRQKFLLE